jgi:hypothetical protein
MKPLGSCVRVGDIVVWSGGVDPLAGASIKRVGGASKCVRVASIRGAFCLSSGMLLRPLLGLAGFRTGGACVGLPLDICVCDWPLSPTAPGTLWGGIAVKPSGGTTRPMRVAFFDERRVGRRVHLRFLPAHLEQGNFLSHLVFVLAQLLQAMGVRPADLGIMPLTAGISCWFWSLPCTV